MMLITEPCTIHRIIIIDTTLKNPEYNADLTKFDTKMTPQQMLDFILQNTKPGCKIHIFMHTDDCFLFIDTISYISKGEVEYHSWSSSSKYKDIDIGTLVRC
jgi:hypothetical protein